MPEPVPDEPAGEPVTSLILSLTRQSSGITWPGTTAAVATLPGHHPDLLVTLAEMAEHAANDCEPMRCQDCASGPGPCEACRGDEAKVRIYRGFAEALRAAR